MGSRWRSTQSDIQIDVSIHHESANRKDPISAAFSGKAGAALVLPRPSYWIREWGTVQQFWPDRQEIGRTPLAVDEGFGDPAAAISVAVLLVWLPFVGDYRTFLSIPIMDCMELFKAFAAA